MELAPDTETLEIVRHAKDLRDGWQGRILAASLRLEGGYVVPSSRLGLCLLSILAHSFDDAMPVLLRVVFPGFRSIGAPFLCEAGRIAKTGHVMASLIDSNGTKIANQALYRNTHQMQTELRRFADRLRFDEAERAELFAAARRWVVCDYRLDPTMNPADPDAKRLTVN